MNYVIQRCLCGGSPKLHHVGNGMFEVGAHPSKGQPCPGGGRRVRVDSWKHGILPTADGPRGVIVAPIGLVP